MTLSAERPAVACPERRRVTVDPARRRRGARRAALLLVLRREPEALREGGGDRQDSFASDTPHLRADAAPAQTFVRQWMIISPWRVPDAVRQEVEPNQVHLVAAAVSCD